MLRRSGRILTGAAAGSFSSASFTGDDEVYSRLQKERDRLAQEFNSYANPEGDDVRTGGTGADQRRRPYFSDRPTIETYRAMSDEHLIAVFNLRERQVRQLRHIYANFHYEADKCFRTMVLDYHDKALQLSQVHGQMQAGSLQISREALSKMREEQEMLTRDKRIIFIICLTAVTIFWVWVRRHHVAKKDLENATLVMRSSDLTPTLGAGSYGENIFGSAKRNARNRETSWEREVRERREAKALEASRRKQAELEKELAVKPRATPEEKETSSSVSK